MNSFTGKLKLRKPAIGDENWADEWHNNADISDVILGALLADNKVISGGTVAFGVGLTANYNDTVVEIAGVPYTIAAGSLVLDAAAPGSEVTNWIYVNDAGVVISALVPPSGDYVPLALADVSNTVGLRLADLRPKLASSASATSVSKILVSTLAVLRAIPTLYGQALMAGRVSQGDGGQGRFWWNSTDLSAEVAADTLSGIYVASNSDPTGASGAWVRPHDGVAEVSWYGTTDAAVRAALASGLKVVHAGVGTVAVVGQITIPADVTFYGDGADKTIFTAAGDVAGTYTNNSVIYKAGSTPVQIADLLSDVIKGAKAIPFAAAHNLSVGSIFMIYNPTDYSFSGARTYYRAGEYCTVSKVISTTEVEVENGLYDSYLAASVDIYSCAGYASGKLAGFSAIAPGPGAKDAVKGLEIAFAYKVTLDGIKATNSGNASMSISKCYKIRATNIDAQQWSPNVGLGTQYGLLIGNSQELDISGSFIGNRHGIAQGGGDDFAIPVRGSYVHDFVAKNTYGTLAAADWHGNVEHSVYERGMVFIGGLNITGNHNRISHIKAHGPDMMLILGREILGCDHIVECVDCWTGVNDTSRGIINIGGNETAMDAVFTKYGGDFVFRNITIDAPNNTRHAIGIRNRGFIAGSFSVLADNVNYIAPNSNSTSFPVLDINTVSGNACSRASATSFSSLQANATPPFTLGALDAACLVRQDGLSGKVDVTTTAAITNIQSVVSFGKKFAKAPSVYTNPSNDTTNGFDRLSSCAASITASQFTARLRRVDETGNFTAAATITLNWAADLKEW